MNNNEGLTLKFKAKSFRKIPNPYLHMDSESQDAMMYFAICDVKDVPDNIPMETNPREQKLTTNVAKKIRSTLVDINNSSFYLLNRGLLLSAKSVSYNNYTDELTIFFENFDVHGNVDGGHTYKIIRDCKDQLDYGKQFVKLEILTGVESIFQELAAARNTSVQVQDKSIAELENRFDIIKNAIKDESFSNDVFFKENDNGEIDVADILAILNLFNIERYSGMDNFPIVSYSSKKKCIDYYIDSHKNYGETSKNPYVKMIPLMVDFFKLYDEIESNMNLFYKQKNPSGRYGAVKGVQLPKPDHPIYTKFYHHDLDCISPSGFLYPILGSLRALIREKEGVYIWTENPFKVLNKLGSELVETTVERSRTLGNNPQSVGKDSGNWKTLYMTVALELANGD